MGVCVQKFGGSSVADGLCMERVVDIIGRKRREGYAVAVVVSARKGVTDALIAEATRLDPAPHLASLDRLLATGEQESVERLCCALEGSNIPAVPYTGGQAGFLTNNAHGSASLINVTGGDIKERLRKGAVAVVAGFQGVTEDGALTTLGRGGSDLTAIALAAALRADQTEIFTDVAGVYSVDPHIVPSAVSASSVSFRDLAEFSALGAKVMQARSVIFAMRANLPFWVKSSFRPELKGTWVKPSAPDFEGIAIDRLRVKIFIDAHDFSLKNLSELLTQSGVQADGFKNNGPQLSVTIPQNQLWTIKTLLEKRGIAIEDMHPIARVSYVGPHVNYWNERLGDLGMTGELLGKIVGSWRLSLLAAPEKGVEIVERWHEKIRPFKDSSLLSS